MPKLYETRFTFEDDNGVVREYAVAVSLDDNAIMQDEGRSRVTARSRQVTPPASDWAEVSLDVVFDFARDQCCLEHDGNRFHCWPIATVSEHLMDEVIEDQVAGTMEDGVLQLVSEVLDSTDTTFAEALISAFPTDPFIGCVVKGSVSTLIGQGIRCSSRDEGADDAVRFLLKARGWFGCLRKNAGKMAWTATKRTVRCMGMLGFG